VPQDTCVLEVLFASRVVCVRCERDVLKLLDKVDLEEGGEVVKSIRRDTCSVLHKYKGALGKTSLEELLQLEGDTYPMNGLVYLDTSIILCILLEKGSIGLQRHSIYSSICQQFLSHALLITEFLLGTR